MLSRCKAIQDMRGAYRRQQSSTYSNCVSTQTLLFAQVPLLALSASLNLRRDSLIDGGISSTPRTVWHLSFIRALPRWFSETTRFGSTPRSSEQRDIGAWKGTPGIFAIESSKTESSASGDRSFCGRGAEELVRRPTQLQPQRSSLSIRQLLGYLTVLPARGFAFVL